MTQHCHRSLVEVVDALGIPPNDYKSKRKKTMKKLISAPRVLAMVGLKKTKGDGSWGHIKRRGDGSWSG